MEAVTDVNTVGIRDTTTPFPWPIQTPLLEITLHLIRAVTGVNTVVDLSSGGMHLHMAIEGDPRVISHLIALGANANAVDMLGYTPLHRAIILLSSGDLSMADYFPMLGIIQLIAAGADVNTVDLLGYTPLHAAIARGRSGIIGQLIRAGADVNKADALSRTPLHLAILCNYPEIVLQLIAAGADVNAVDRKGATPLHLAIEDYGPSGIAAQLIEAGADVNAVDREGATPLHWAVKRNNREAVKWLLTAGSDAYLRTNNGQTALDMTTLESDSEIKVLLARR
jgi:ankyrin repeat protein